MATNSPPAISSVSSEPALWLNDAESQPLLQQSTVDDKQEPHNSPVDLGPAPRGLGPIQLAPDDDETTNTPPARQSRRFNNLFEEVPEEHRSALHDIGKGLLYIFTTPIAFAAVVLYTCGRIIEGVGLILKGIGSLGGTSFMKRNRAPPSPTPEALV